MKFTIPLALAAGLAGSAVAQQSGDAGSYAAGLLQALQSANLTTLASAASNFTDLVGVLQQGGNKTVLAPTNEAFAALGNVPAQDVLKAVITYHVVNGTVDVTQLAAAPAHNVSYTFLTNSTYVQLPGGRGQVQVFSKASNGTAQVVQDQRNVSFASNSNGPTYQNLRVQPINEVLMIPGNLSTVAGQLGASSFANAASSAQLVAPLEASTSGLTIFVPNNAAFQAAQSALAGANQTAVQTVLANHVLNGTVAYSTLLTGSNPVTSAISAAGNNLTFAPGPNGGLQVKSGNVTANIIRTDVLFSNGVAHVIDQVLATTTSNQDAANSAFNSATSQAAAQPTGAAPSSGGGSNAAGALAVSGIAAAAVAAIAGAIAVL